MKIPLISHVNPLIMLIMVQTIVQTTFADVTIDTPAKLLAFANSVNTGTDYKDQTITLDNDIKLTGKWTPIGTDSTPFKGTFDGNGHVISGVYIGDSLEYRGLFGYLQGGIIKNVGVEVDGINGRNYVGGLVGYNNGGVISNCYAEGNVTGIDYYVGILVGQNDGLIFNSYSKGNVKIYEGTSVGGLVGYNNGSISNSYATGIADGVNEVGGLVGTNTGSISNSYASVEISGRELWGNLVGSNYNGKIINSYSITHTLMTNKEIYNWNFESIWDIDPHSNDSLPYLQWQNDMRAVQYSVNSQVYTGSKIIPPKLEVILNGDTLKEGTDFEYRYGDNTNVSTGGIVYIVGLQPKYFGTKIVNFAINTPKIVDVVWIPGCDVKFTYNGKVQGPVPTAQGYELDYDFKNIEARSYTRTATLKEPGKNNDVTLQNTTCGYTIERKELFVEWSGPLEFVYNKENQTPTATVSDGGDTIELNWNRYEAAGPHSIMATIIDDSLRPNYILRNNTVQYEILKKPLKTYFDTSLANFSTNPGKDTLWVPKETFGDSAALHQVLAGLINYDGFATNSKGESDDKTSLNGNPNVSLQYPLATSHSPLSKRVETTQKATATIITDNVSADNYALARTNIVIMETVEEEDFVKKIACFRGNYCTTLDEDVCSFINGEEVSNCTTLRKFCFINNGPCVANMLVSECAGIGGTVAKTDEQGTCQAVPILPTIHSPLATSHLPKYYTLHGQPLGTQKPSTPGIYIEKAGYQARKIMVK